jgi:hypothetical protein
VKGACGGFCTEAEGKTEEGSGHVHVKEGEGREGGSLGALRGEKDGGGGGPVIRQGARPAGAGDGLPGVAAWEQGHRGVRLGWPWLGRCHGPAQAHNVIL